MERWLGSYDIHAVLGSIMLKDSSPAILLGYLFTLPPQKGQRAVPESREARRRVQQHNLNKMKQRGGSAVAR
jgi:hypothetical protein